MPNALDEHWDLPEAWAGYARVAAWYPISIILGGVVPSATAQAAGSVQLRPEPFVLKRITWATSGDVPPFNDAPNGMSVQGRSVVMDWQDEFTQFFGSRQTMVAAVFGDSNGFLDLPSGLVFSGKQTLSVRLTRLFWPTDATPADTRWDFVFSGYSMLRSEYQSGSAG